MQRVIAFIVIVVLALATAACAPNVVPTETAATPETAATEAPAEPTAGEATAEATAEPENPTEVPATAAPTAEATEEATLEPATPETGTDVSAEGVRFSFAPDIASGVTAETIPATQDDPNAPYWASMPTTQVFYFEDYPLENTFHEARIEVYPAREFASLNSVAKDQINQLRQILEAQPTDFSATDPEDRLPFLPLFNAAQVFRVQPAYVPFTNGAGLRYITYYAQDVSPVTNNGLFYTYQGLTNDGEYYVSAIFPVRTDALPDEVDYDNLDYQSFADNFDSYLTETTSALNELSSADFTPDLATLDDIVASINVDREPPPPPTDEAGNLVLSIAYPLSGGQVRIGEELDVSGFVAPEVNSVDVALMAGNNSLASTTAAVEAATGRWSTRLTVPRNVIGRARVVATTPEESASASILLQDTAIGQEPPAGEPVLQLMRPILGETAAAGYPLYFEGSVENPIDDTVTVGVLVDACTTFAARQEITVAGGNWNGVVILPGDVEDENACAVAYTGAYGEGNWREVQMPLPVLSPDDPLAMRIALEEGTNLQFEAGGTATIAGTAVGAPEVRVTIQSPEDESVLAEGTAPVGEFGFWEIELPVPETAPDFVIVEISLVEEDAPEPYLFQTGATVTR